MDDLRRAQSKAVRSRLSEYDLPIVETREDALRLAEVIATYLANATPDERALLVSDLAVLERGMARRLRRLDRNMGAIADELRLLNRARSARLAYARTRSAPRGKDRPPCR